MRVVSLIPLVSVLLLLERSSSSIRSVSAFVAVRTNKSNRLFRFATLPHLVSTPASSALITSDGEDANDTAGRVTSQQQLASFVLPHEKLRPYINLGKGDKTKIVNLFGLWVIMATLLTAPIWSAAMTLVHSVHKMTNGSFDPIGELYDKTGKVWCRIWLRMIHSFPTLSGDVESMRQGHGGACLYVANHASWLDIPVICTVLDPTAKFIAKGELKNVPCIGQQLSGGQHILIDRDDKRSQLQTFKSAIGWLKQGVPIIAFPEGGRSPDGRLIQFKGGLFSMAKKTNVPIVPITICNTHAIMPRDALLPVQPGYGKLHVHVHERIEPSGRTEDEMVQLVRQAFISSLPLDQQPLLDDVVDTTAVSSPAS